MSTFSNASRKMKSVFMQNKLELHVCQMLQTQLGVMELQNIEKGLVLSDLKSGS